MARMHYITLINLPTLVLDDAVTLTTGHQHLYKQPLNLISLFEDGPRHIHQNNNPTCGSGGEMNCNQKREKGVMYTQSDVRVQSIK